MTAGIADYHPIAPAAAECRRRRMRASIDYTMFILVLRLRTDNSF